MTNFTYNSIVAPRPARTKAVTEIVAPWDPPPLLGAIDPRKPALLLLVASSLYFTSPYCLFTAISLLAFLSYRANKNEYRLHFY